MKAQPGPIVKLFTEVAPDIFKSYFRDDSCINATRVTIEVLKCFGVVARPLSVRFVAMNKLFAERANKLGGNPDPATLDKWVEDGGWALGIDIDNPGEPGKYAGHVVAIAQDHLIDSSARQFTRPAKGIVLPDVFVGPVTKRFLKGKDPMIGVDDESGAVCWYRARLDDRAFAGTPGWQLSFGNAQCANAIIYAMSKKLGLQTEAL